MTSAYHIRPERRDDLPLVHSINSAAFGRVDEAKLVDKLRSNAPGCLSLVAEIEGEVIGHIFFSPVRIEYKQHITEAVALGPMAVRPDRQGQGVGRALVRSGISACRSAGHRLVFVLGHTWFYPKFGFKPAARWGFTCQWEVEEPYFMLLEIADNAAACLQGMVRYRPEFSEA